MKTKLLKEYRSLTKRKIGVFNYNGNYIIVFDKDTICPNVSDYPENEELKKWQILETNIKTLKEAKLMCDYYRREYILQLVRERRYGSSKRFY